jgi:hypothetical protein
VRRSPSLAGEIAAGGHELACHGDTHQSLAGLPPAATAAARRRAGDSIADACGQPPRFYRPAYGVFNLAGWAVAPRLGMRRTLWSAWARDWEERATPALIAARVLRTAKPALSSIIEVWASKSPRFRRSPPGCKLRRTPTGCLKNCGGMDSRPPARRSFSPIAFRRIAPALPSCPMWPGSHHRAVVKRPRPGPQPTAGRFPGGAWEG